MLLLTVYRTTGTIESNHTCPQETTNKPIQPLILLMTLLALYCNHWYSTLYWLSNDLLMLLLLTLYYNHWYSTLYWCLYWHSMQNQQPDYNTSCWLDHKPNWLTDWLTISPYWLLQVLLTWLTHRLYILNSHSFITLENWNPMPNTPALNSLWSSLPTPLWMKAQSFAFP